MRTIQVTRYITPLREGGSLPALAEGDDEFKYVLKFRGSGHGPKALIAELIGGEIARVLGLKIPELVFAEVDEAFGRTEADEEIQDLLQGSQGLNLALHFLSSAITFDPTVTNINSKLASQIVWFDALITNVDRTVKNTNMLMWNNELWLIDHGASLYFQHSWTDWETQAKSKFSFIIDHVLLPHASKLDVVNKEYSNLLTEATIKEIVQLIPDEWLVWEDTEASPDALRAIYTQFLWSRLNHSEVFTNEATHARENLI